MENSLAKDGSRELFYDFVKKSFTKPELKQARAVVLLGKDMLELPHLDKLGVSRHRVTSVEKDIKIYRDQHLWNMQQDQKHKVELFSYDLNDYLRFLRDRKQSVEIFNLDIFGSLQNNILPQFKNIITMTKDQPKTVIGTYLTAGRDRHVLLRTLEPVIWLLLFDQQFKIVIEKLVIRFMAAGYTTPIAFHHAFRVMQWLYYMLLGLTAEWHPKRAKMMSFEKIPAKVWAHIFQKSGKKADILTWEMIIQATSQAKLNNGLRRLTFSCGPTQLNCVSYRNVNWTQLCQYMKLEQRAEITFSSIIEVFINGVLEIKFIDRGTTKATTLKLGEQNQVFDAQEVLERDLVKELRSRLKPITVIPSKSQPDRTSPNPRSLWSQKDGFTSAGLTFLRSKADEGLKPKQIAKYFPKATPPLSISAHVAINNRKFSEVKTR